MTCTLRICFSILCIICLRNTLITQIIARAQSFWPLLFDAGCTRATLKRAATMALATIHSLSKLARPLELQTSTYLFIDFQVTSIQLNCLVTMKHSMMHSSQSSYGMALSDRENQPSAEVSSMSLRADSDNCGDNLNYEYSQQQERTSSSSLSSSTVQNETRSSVQVTTIALFGAHGKTGNYFLKFALDAGYHVRALVPAESSSERAKKQHTSKASNSSSTLKSTSTSSTSSALQEFDDKTALTKVSGELDDSKAIKRVLKGADYVVCLLTDTLPSSKHQYPKDCLAGFLRRLYPLMQREKSIQVFLYQVGSVFSVSISSFSALFTYRILQLFQVKC